MLLGPALGLSAILFSLGVAGVLLRRNAIVLFMCIELMLNAVNLTFVALAQLHGAGGYVMVFFVMTVAAAEAAVGLAIILGDVPPQADGRPAEHQPAAGLMTLSLIWVWLAVALPAGLGFLVNGALAIRRPARQEPGLGRRGRACCWAPSWCRSASSSSCCGHPPHAPIIVDLWRWMPVGNLQIDFAFQVDQLSAVMLLVVTGVGSLIHLFSVGYMRRTPGTPGTSPTSISSSSSCWCWCWAPASR